MKLSDYLKTLPVDQVITIAPINGTGFLYIGDAGNTDLIQLVSDNLIYQSRCLLQEYNRRAMAVRSGAQCYSLARNLSSAAKQEKYIKCFVPLLEREVYHTWNKNVDNAIGIKAEGDETGRFWLKSEFDKYSRNLHAVL